MVMKMTYVTFVFQFIIVADDNDEDDGGDGDDADETKQRCDDGFDWMDFQFRDANAHCTDDWWLHENTMNEILLKYRNKLPYEFLCIENVPKSVFDHFNVDEIDSVFFLQEIHV